MEFDFSKEPGTKQEQANVTVPRECQPKLSIITPFYNAGKHFEQTYYCIINQTFKEFEWIIVND